MLKQCPRCELNWIDDTEDYCRVCKAEMGLDDGLELNLDIDADEEKLCPLCHENYLEDGEKICAECREKKRKKLISKDDYEELEIDLDEDDEDDEENDEEEDEKEDIDDDDDVSLDDLAEMEEEENE